MDKNENNDSEQVCVDDPESEDFLEHQTRIILDRIGKIDPRSIDDYIETGGYQAIRKAFRVDPEIVVDVIKRSNIRGRGGGGFPTGMKWETCKNAAGEEKYIICNGNESDPGAFMDRSLMEGDPHAIIEGMLIGGYAIGATKGYIYSCIEYKNACDVLKTALEQAREGSFLGENILNSGYSLNIELKRRAVSYVCGESTALMFSIEGKRGMPRIRPPQSVIEGLWRKPTVLNNVETFANIPHIILNGYEWFNSFGSKESKGTKIFALSGNVKNTGLIEVNMGTTLRKIIFDIGGGIKRKRKFKAVHIGGPLGGSLPEDMLNLPIDFDALMKAGAIMGSGSMVVLDEFTCMVNMAKYFIDFIVKESCGKCVPCRIGIKTIQEILSKIVSGNGELKDLDLLEDLANHIRRTALCGLGKFAPNPVLTGLKYFRREYETHINEKVCPFGVCVDLTRFEVSSERCKKCGLCVKECPSNAISGGPKELAVIDKEKCVKCRTCIDICPARAIV